jgi:hypothetical protein
MRPDELESLVGGSLRRLPAPRAPQTLLPRIMAAVNAWAQRPWCARAWFTWPLGLQMASGAALLVLVAGAAASVAYLDSGSAPVMSAIASRVAGAGAALQTIGAAFDVLWRAIVGPVAPYALAVMAMMGLACAGGAAALNQIVLGRAAHR